jgi:hypothetical protein
MPKLWNGPLFLFCSKPSTDFSQACYALESGAPFR